MERVNIQLRAEMFNVFNRTNFAPPSSTTSTAASSTSGTTGATTPTGFLLNDTIGDYNGAPGIGAGEPFNMQLGAKIIF